MNKWTWLALLAFVAILGGAYYLLSHSSNKNSRPDGGARSGEMMDVEEFDAADGGGEPGDKGDNAFEMLDDGEGGGAPEGASAPGAGTGSAIARATGQGLDHPADIQTIEDPDDNGEMVKDPELIEDSEDAGVSVDSRAVK